MQETIAPPLDDDRRYRMEIIGEFVQPKAEVLVDKDRKSVAVEPGRYPVVGAMSVDGKHLREGGVIFSGANRETGEAQTLVQFHSSKELQALSKSGKLQLELGRDQAIFADRGITQRSSQAEKSRQGLRR